MQVFRALPSSLILTLFIAAILTFLPAPVARAAEDSGFQFRKVSELQRIQPKKPVKVKLKRTARGEYSWELSGDDAGEILKVDKELRKVLKPQRQEPRP